MSPRRTFGCGVSSGWTLTTVPTTWTLGPRFGGGNSRSTAGSYRGRSDAGASETAMTIVSYFTRAFDTYQRAALARRAPSTIASSFAHAMVGCTRGLELAPVLNPQSVPAWKRSLPTTPA